MRVVIVALLFLLFTCAFISAKVDPDRCDQLYEKALALYSKGNVKDAKQIMDQFTVEEIESESHYCLLAALIEESRGNSDKCIALLVRGWQLGHEDLICPLSFYQLNARNYKWMRAHEARIMRAIANKAENHRLAIRALYGLGIALRDIEILRNVMSQVSDEDIVKDKELAFFMLDMHLQFLEIAAQSTEKDDAGKGETKEKQ
jgi:hypothetical protein